MNWLAHIQLSGDSPATRIGNLLPDLMRASELGCVSEQFLPGIQLHRIIDSYTDSHANFRQSVVRVDGPLRRFAPIIVDIFYDHFLTLEWSSFSAISLEAVVNDFHQSIDSFRMVLPEAAYIRLAEIRDADYLMSYSSEDGIAAALARVSSRLRRRVDLSVGVEKLRTHYDFFATDFRGFYPQLLNHIKKQAAPRS